jgi:beta-lactamase regulating signal transducer with metallopeptidase domain
MFEKIGLPPIPMVPVSSSQVIVGCVLGIGLYKGARNINFRILGEIAIGWIATPVASGLLAFLSLFFMKNIFNINVGTKASLLTNHASMNGMSISGGTETSEIIRYLILGLIIFGTLGLAFYLLLERKKRNDFQKSEEKFWMNMK